MVVCGPSTQPGLLGGARRQGGLRRATALARGAAGLATRERQRPEHRGARKTGAKRALRDHTWRGPGQAASGSPDPPLRTPLGRGWQERPGEALFRGRRAHTHTHMHSHKNHAPTTTYTVEQPSNHQHPHLIQLPVINLVLPHPRARQRLRGRGVVGARSSPRGRAQERSRSRDLTTHEQHKARARAGGRRARPTFGTAAAGAVVNHSGCWLASPYPRTTASAGSRSRRARSALATTSAHAPSDSGDELPAVIEPPSYGVRRRRSGGGAGSNGAGVFKAGRGATARRPTRSLRATRPAAGRARPSLPPV